VKVLVSGPEPSQREDHTLCEGEEVRIGRAPQKGWKIPWDRAISREHADLVWQNGKLRVTCTPNARNPLVYRNEPTRKLLIAPADSFQIGQTVFRLMGSERPSSRELSDVKIEYARETAMAVGERAYSEEELRRVAFGNTERQMEVLSSLPRTISVSHSDQELGALLSRLLLDAIPHADAVAVAHYDERELPQDESAIDEFPKPLMARVETREDFAGRFSPSRRLILNALLRQTSLMHVWRGQESSEEFTISEGLGWAFCCPIRGEMCRGWCMYVSGRGSKRGGFIASEDDLAGDLRFTELVAQFIGSVREVRLLQAQKTQLSTFFSPKVIENLTDERSRRALEPAERDISVLFCDVRGFSKKSEELQEDLLKLLKSVSAALGVMAGGILERDGAIADFQGDAALGFWGWPVELEEGPVPACRAALSIDGEFRRAARRGDSLLEGFSVGIGIAHGRALAGQIGTDMQAKVGVFGPVVNQGARLQGMTKKFGVPICIDETTADYAKRLLPPAEGRVMRLARLRPVGMDTALTVYGLLPPLDQYPEITGQMIADYDEAVEAMIDGLWSQAIASLARLPDEHGPTQFLLRQMAEWDNRPPENWDGAFSLKSK
jgi:adenylate cyclase